ncbi:MAG: phosphoribosylformylglycinamidine synthase, partial [Christensenellaceae bacterium]|nr:phosphoribosylformylglycinamidine synthase [Christensenellaceae bacterium]
MVFRVYIEKKPGLENEANALLGDIRQLLLIDGVKKLRLLNRYDVENIEASLFEYCKNTVFAEPQLDITYDAVEADGCRLFAVEYLPGQFDQRADSAAQCIQIISQTERPVVRTAKVYMIYGDISEEEFAQIKKYVINPVEAREAALELPETLAMEYDVPTEVKTLHGFLNLNEADLAAFIDQYGLAMDLDDIKFCQKYFASEKRDPTITEIKMIDTYWSDHCRHTTFGTIIDSVKFEDEL